MTLSKDQRGFSAIELILVILILLAICALGYEVAHKSKTAVPVTASTKVSPPASQTTTPVDAKIYSDNTGLVLYEIDRLASTSDQKSIAAALDNVCQAHGDVQDDTFVAITGVSNLFNDSNNFKLDGNYAKVNSGCFDKTAGTPPDGSGANSYLKRSGGSWLFVIAAQQATSCKLWDNNGVPKDIVSTCVDSSTGNLRQPLQ